MVTFSKFSFRRSAMALASAAVLVNTQANAQNGPTGSALTPVALPATSSYIVLLNPDRLLTPRSEQVRDDRFALFQREWGYLSPRVVGDVQAL